MISTRQSASRFIDLLTSPQLAVAALGSGETSPDALQEQAAAWVKAVVRPVRDEKVAFEGIAWAQRLSLLTPGLTAEDRLALREFLSGLPGDVDEQTLKEQPLLHQLLAAELALTLATQLLQNKLAQLNQEEEPRSRIPAGRLTVAAFSRRLEKNGRAAISLGLNRILDRQGMLPAEHFSLLRPLLACWTRCRAMAARLPGGHLGPRPEQRYQLLVRNALRCNRPDGRPLFAASGSDPSGGRAWGRELFEAVLNNGTGDVDRRLAALALPNVPGGAVAGAAKKAAALPTPSVYWEEGAVAVMRRNWQRDAERIAVLFAGRACELELIASGQVAASGTWRLEITQHGQPLLAVSDWKSSCWYSDKDVDYLELEIELAAGVTVQRQIVLAREDRFLLLADAVMGPPTMGTWCPGSLEYRGIVPLAPQVEFRGAPEGREGLLLQRAAAASAGKSARSARPLAQVLPLGMPEWRAEAHQGELQATAEGLELRQAAAGGRLYAPLFIDLDRNRFRRRMTWRRLTVAESLAAVPAEIAVGFRVAIGDRQWLIYRSLAATSNRTVLGHNLATESLLARFGKDGEVTSIVEIE